MCYKAYCKSVTSDSFVSVAAGDEICAGYETAGKETEETKEIAKLRWKDRGKGQRTE